MVGLCLAHVWLNQASLSRESTPSKLTWDEIPEGSLWTLGIGWQLISQMPEPKPGDSSCPASFTGVHSSQWEVIQREMFRLLTDKLLAETLSSSRRCKTRVSST